MTVRVPSACRYRSSVYPSVAPFSASTAASSRQTNRYGASGSLSWYLYGSSVTRRRLSPSRADAPVDRHRVLLFLQALVPFGVLQVAQVRRHVHPDGGPVAVGADLH